MHVADKTSLKYCICMIRKTAHMDIHQYEKHSWAIQKVYQERDPSIIAYQISVYATMANQFPGSPKASISLV